MMKKILLFMPFLAMTLMQAQVSLVKDINPGSGDGVGTKIVASNNKIIFAGDDGSNEFGLWISDGTLANTFEFKASNYRFKNPTNLYDYSSQNIIAFSADLGGLQGTQLWFYNSLTSNYAGNSYNLSGDSEPSDFGQIQGFLILAATNGTDGKELAYGSTSSGSDFIQDINVGNGSSDPKGFIKLGNNHYFSANNGINGRELWSVPFIIPNSASQFIDINIGSASSNPDNFILFNNKLYFTADDGINGIELWVTDGTTLGTQRMYDVNPIAGDLKSPENFIIFNNALYFTATHPTLGTELFKLGGTTFTNVKNIAVGNNSSNPSNLYVFNGTLYFSADDNTNGIELWSSTGFSSTTNMIKNINTNAANPDSNPSGFTEYFGELFFSANDGTNGIELWKTDGTNTGTVLVDDINPSGDSNPTDLIVANNILFFTADNGSSGMELWKYQDASLSVKNLELENSVSLFPNPTTTSFSIETKYQITNISVLDIQGKTVKSFKENLAFYDVEELTSGLYFVNIETELGKITKKLIKE